MLPASAAVSPASALASVVLPAPLRPTRPTRSPAAMWNVAPSSRVRAPTCRPRSTALINWAAPLNERSVGTEGRPTASVRVGAFLPSPDRQLHRAQLYRNTPTGMLRPPGPPRGDRGW